jgi:hypothetical protein
MRTLLKDDVEPTSYKPPFKFDAASTNETAAAAMPALAELLIQTD